MNLDLFFVCIFLFVSQTGLIFYLNQRLSSLAEVVEDTASRLNGFPAEEFNPHEMIAEVKRGIEEVVADTIENLEPPRAIDHVFGAVAQLIQMKAMGAMNMLPEGVVNMAESVMGSSDEV